MTSEPVKRTSEQIVRLWEQYSAKHEPEIRNNIVDEYLYIVKCIASHMYGVYRNYAEMDDIVSCGVVALISAVDRYNPALDVKFETFASIRVRGAMLDYLRKQDWVPRSVRKNARDIERAYASLTEALGREPSDKEVAAHMGISESEYAEMLGRSHAGAVLSFEELIEKGADKYGQDFTSPYDSPEKAVTDSAFEQLLAESVDKLGERERTIISLYYYEGVKGKQIAQILGISESRVSQIHAQALAKLRGEIEQYI